MGESFGAKQEAQLLFHSWNTWLGSQLGGPGGCVWGSQLAAHPAFGSRGASTILLLDVPLPFFFFFPSSLLPVQLQLCLQDSHRREQSAEPCFPVFVCLERLTPPAACLLCLTLLEAQIPYQPFPQDSLTLFSPNEGLRQWGPCCIFWQPPLWSCSISFLLWVNQIKQISLDYPQKSLVLPLLGEQILSGTGGIFMARQNTFSRASLFLCRD